MEFNHGFTLQEYKDAMLANAKVEICKICKYPDTSLILSEEEEKFISNLRFTEKGEEFKHGDSIDAYEEIQVIEFRAKKLQSYIDLEKSIQEAIAASSQIKGECYFHPYHRAVILVRKPTLDEYDNHMIEIGMIEDESHKCVPRETSMKRYTTKQLFARKMVVFPGPAKLAEYCSIKPNLMADVYAMVMNLASDQMQVELLKYRGL